MKANPFFSLQVVAKLFLLTCSFFVLSYCAHAQTVYVTNTGIKYHSSGCQYLSKSKIAIQVDSAISKNYSACSVCKPKVSKSTTTQGITESIVTVKSASTTQCVVLTKAGNRCSRMTKESNGRCWQHQ